MGLLVKARTTTIGEATLQMQHLMQTENPIEMVASMLPAEWFPQSGVMVTWPHEQTDWQPYLKEVTECYIRLAYHISRVEHLVIVTPQPAEVRRLLKEQLPKDCLQRVLFAECSTDDTWTRDHGPLCVRQEGHWLLKDFRFDGWGGKFEASNDNAITRHVYEQGLLNGALDDCLDMVLEGGSIESDGRGTLLTTTSCLLNPNRNPQMNQADIETRVLHEFQAHRLLWLSSGHLEGDDTDGHIDTLARFCPNNTIAYVKCTDKSDSHYTPLAQMEEELRTFRTDHDEPYRLVPLPLPDPITWNGERLPATYANFLVINDEVLMPTYHQPEHDEEARQALQTAFPHHAITDIDSSVLIRQHGSLHCSTMQLPRGVVNEHQHPIP